MSLQEIHDGGSDPLNYISPPDVRWTTRNYGEALPGVPTPLTWSIWGAGLNFALDDMLIRTGCMTEEEIEAFNASGHRAQTLFYGRLAGNVDYLSNAFARMPGIDPSEFERYVFGVEPGSRTPTPDSSRAAVIAVKSAEVREQQPQRLVTLSVESETWWRATVEGELDPSTARLRLVAARELFGQVMAVHGLFTPLAQEAYARVAEMAAAAGHAGAEASLFAGLGGLEEARVMDDLWHLANGGLDIETFLSQHGYHGPNEAELASPSWREDRHPVLKAADAMRGEPESDRPKERAARRRVETEARIEDLCRALAPQEARAFRDALTTAVQVMTFREQGKAAFLRALDGARRAAGVIGRELARDQPGVGEDAVFYLTIDEVVDGVADISTVVAERRAVRSEYQEITIPGNWVGNPEPVNEGDGAEIEAGSVLSGVPASGGVAEGTVRVIHDPYSVEPLDEDEILVARTTDPGWVPLFMRAGALVVDIGTPMSHAAIIARELGLPCVVNTGDGTSRLIDGMRVRVDGTIGTVEVLAGP